MASKIKLEAPDKVSSLEPIIDRTKPEAYEPISRDDLSVSLPLNLIGQSEGQEATLTLVVSDTHFGDADHLPNTFMSCVENLKAILTKLEDKLEIKNFILVLNGDIVAGKDVYRNQHLRNIIQRGHWQTELAAQMLRELKTSIAEIHPIDKTFIVKGNHESIADNYMIYLTNYLDNTWYAGHSKVLNIAYPIGQYNVLFTHGFGRSEYYPVGYGMVRDCWKSFTQYATQGIHIEEVCTGHTHWLQPRLYLEGITFNVTGGFQRWEKTISQRPSGFLLLIHTGGETSVTGIRADPVVEADEQTASDLEFRNLDFYGAKLRAALQYIKSKPEPEEVVL